jgi:hypothetical protein
MQVSYLCVDPLLPFTGPSESGMGSSLDLLPFTGPLESGVSGVLDLLPFTGPVESGALGVLKLDSRDGRHDLIGR